MRFCRLFLIFAIICSISEAYSQKAWTYEYNVDTPEGKGLCEKEESGYIVASSEHGTLSNEDIVLRFKAGHRSPRMSVILDLPASLDVRDNNCWINIIGRGEVRLDSLTTQSIGRYASIGRPDNAGEYKLTTSGKKTTLALHGLDLRPDNGDDIVLRIPISRKLKPGALVFSASYMTSEPYQYRSKAKSFTMAIKKLVTDLAVDYSSRYFSWKENLDIFLTWSNVKERMTLKASEDGGKTWNTLCLAKDGKARISNSKLRPDVLYSFSLFSGNKKMSNTVQMRTGEWQASNYLSKGNDDNTSNLDDLIREVHLCGGGIIHMPSGITYVTTVHLKSNVWLHIPSDAVLKALPGGDGPERTWFSDRKYRSGLSPTDHKPYDDAANFLTKQDVGHTFFANAMFYAQREENIRIIGSGRITGNGNLVTTDKVMNNAKEKRKDKMFSLKLCRNIEIGGHPDERDLWYDEQKDMPYYIGKNGNDYDCSQMLKIDQGGHFVLLATGTDNIYVHDTYFGKDAQNNVRDIYDFMACSDVKAYNIYCRISSDDIVKLGSDCSLGFTRPARNYMVRNIIGDTNCNLFQIGSETADDIEHVWVDNIFVLGANKAGFSISANDGAEVRDVHLNDGKTGPLHHISQMRRTRCPIFLSISNRGRTLGADAKMFTFMENGKERKELLITNSPISKIDNISLQNIDIKEVWGGSSFRNNIRWREYTGKENEAPIIIAGFSLPKDENIEGGKLGFTLPDGNNASPVRNIALSNIKVIYKGGHPKEDSLAVPPEIGVGRYNVSDLKTIPSYAIWTRHVDGLRITDCSFSTETPDGREAFKFDDTNNITISNVVSNGNPINR